MDYLQQPVMRDLSQFSKVYLVPLADLHEGARDADHNVSDGYISWIAENKDAFTVLNGDLMNCSTKDSTPDLFEDLITTDDAYDRLVNRLIPIRDKIIMITRGGHEETIFRKSGTDFMARLSHALRPDGVSENDHSRDIPYKPDGGMFGLRLSAGGNHTTIFWGYATHGWGGARTIGSKVKKVEDLANVANVDILILSHDHTAAIHRLNVLDPPRSHIWSKNAHFNFMRKILINTGGFVRYSGYIQRKGYVPQDLGTPRIRLEVKWRGSELVKDIHGSL
jgi:hypothetical protein